MFMRCFISSNLVIRIAKFLGCNTPATRAYGQLFNCAVAIKHQTSQSQSASKCKMLALIETLRRNLEFYLD